MKGGAMLRDHPLADGDVDPASLVLNLLWLVFGGAVAAFGWFIASLVMIVTIIGIPWARAAFDNGVYTLWPFGSKPVARDRIYGEDLGTSFFGFIGNVIWLIVAGWWLAIGHVVAAALLAVTIIGLPFAWAHLKLAGFALWPIGRSIVDSDIRS
jgi:uncharacterized membrane protein YccF (DUF307 family)